MPRAPCCDQKLGLKKGPWTREEDQILINYVENYGHPNWRALPKQAGLLRCGKSCRLRWINYLRPDIKRGNFSPEEEDTIIHLHQVLGNRWSAIAARLPGRTDNEIKNVWHTQLKKRLIKNQNQEQSQIEATPEEDTKTVQVAISCDDSDANNATSQSSAAEQSYESDAPQQSSSSGSQYSSSVTGNLGLFTDEIGMDMLESFPTIDDSFWTDDNMESIVEPPAATTAGLFFAADRAIDDGLDFWYGILLQAEDNLPLPEC